MKRALMLSLAVMAALMAVTATPVDAQAAPPVSKLRVEASAQHTLDSLANDARTHRTENAACLTSYTVKGDSLILSAFGAADYSVADSVSVFPHINWLLPEPAVIPICPLGLPFLHSHVAWGGNPHPSERDLKTSAWVGMWGLLLTVTDSSWRIIVY